MQSTLAEIRYHTRDALNDLNSRIFSLWRDAFIISYDTSLMESS